MDMLEAFAFCPRCAAHFDKRENYLTCANCGLTYYANPKPCTTVILQNADNKYLFVERAVEPKKGWWDLPGGFVEVGETFESGAMREVQEELGITVKELTYIGSFYDTYDYQEIVYPTLAANYIGRVPEGAIIKPADDVASYQFFALEEIPLAKLAFPSMRETIKLLRKLAKN